MGFESLSQITVRGDNGQITEARSRFAPATMNAAHRKASGGHWRESYEWNSADQARYAGRAWAIPVRRIQPVLRLLWKHCEASPSILPALALETNPETEVDHLGARLEAVGRLSQARSTHLRQDPEHWTPWRQISERRLATVCGVSRRVLPKALGAIVELGVAQHHVDWAGTQGRGFIRLRRDILFPKESKSEAYTLFRGRLLYGGLWALIPSLAARAVWLSMLALDPIRSASGEAFEDPDAVRTGRRNRVTAERIIEASGVSRRAVFRAIGQLEACPLWTPDIGSVSWIRTLDAGPWNGLRNKCYGVDRFGVFGVQYAPEILNSELERLREEWRAAAVRYSLHAGRGREAQTRVPHVHRQNATGAPMDQSATGAPAECHTCTGSKEGYSEERSDRTATRDTRVSSDADARSVDHPHLAGQPFSTSAGSANCALRGDAYPPPDLDSPDSAPSAWPADAELEGIESASPPPVPDEGELESLFEYYAAEADSSEEGESWLTVEPVARSLTLAWLLRDVDDAYEADCEAARARFDRWYGISSDADPVAAFKETRASHSNGGTTRSSRLLRMAS